jgi:hypothetical protein
MIMPEVCLNDWVTRKINVELQERLMLNLETREIGF